MIQYALRCDEGHRFESWFQSSAAYDALAASGHVTCAQCGSARVEKTLMAPKLAKGGAEAPEVPVLSQPEGELEVAIAELRRKVEENADYVGRDFAREARAMHEGALPHRAIWGETRGEEARALIEEGVPVAPLPFRPRRKMQ